MFIHKFYEIDKNKIDTYEREEGNEKNDNLDRMGASNQS